MRFIRLLGLGTILALGVGCGLIEKLKPNPKPTTPVQKVSAVQLVDYLNTQASRLQSITFDRATVTARQGLVSMPSLRGNLAACQPRNFRMSGQGGVVNAKIDLGSNPDQFWMFVDAPTVRPTFVFASHTDFESGRARMPEGVPFEPDWVMQALGMTTFSRDAKYDPVKTDEKARTYTLGWPTSTPSGVPIRKEIVFMTEDADSSRGQAQVKRHVIRDARNRVICSADIKSAKTVSLPGGDPRSGASSIVQYPTHIVLHWDAQNFNMDMMLDGAKVNPPLSPKQIRDHFSLPTNLGRGINLAEARFDASR